MNNVYGCFLQKKDLTFFKKYNIIKTKVFRKVDYHENCNHKRV